MQALVRERLEMFTVAHDCTLRTGLTGVPPLVEAQSEVSALGSPSMQYVLQNAAHKRNSSAGLVSPSRHSQRPVASSRFIHSHAAHAQRQVQRLVHIYGAWGICAPCACGSPSHWGQSRSCQIPADSTEPSTAQPQVLRPSVERGELRFSPAAEVANDHHADKSSLYSAGEAQSQTAEPPNASAMEATESLLHNVPSSTLDLPVSSASQPHDFTLPLNGESTQNQAAPAQEEGSWSRGEQITSLADAEQLPSRKIDGDAWTVATLEQGVEDPGGNAKDGWEDYISMVQVRKQAAAEPGSKTDGKLCSSCSYLRCSAQH
jgi:hypothetical protein